MKQQPERRPNYWSNDRETGTSTPGVLEYYGEFALSIIFRIWWALAGLGAAYASERLLGIGEPTVSIIGVSVAAVSLVATLEYTRRL
ncbi:hypothetical protein [Natrinema sp. DC36]|uniref:hypothetical protein n=1 Tax=Natrinema sp. DC36 TaxID=2878680 RepID=UPI001CF04A72|nr:hypothetical protein [Natrinema sp. DC36]